MSRLLGLRGLKVFDFHLVHISLNTEQMERHEKTRAYQKPQQELSAHRREREGSYTRFLEYLRLVSSARMISS
jgi:hypothetical protein